MQEEYKLEHWPIDKFINYERNPRKNDHAVDKMTTAIKEFGFLVPMLAKSDGLVVDGHLRLKAANKLNMTSIPVITVDNLSDAQIKALRLSINRVAAEATFDNDLLALEFEDLQELNFDLELTGFDPDEIDALTPDEPSDTQGDDDAPGARDGDADSKLGNIYELGLHKLMCGDSTDADTVAALMGGGKADLVFTDPPYGVSYDGGHATDHRREKLKNDSDSDIYGAVLPVIYGYSAKDAPLYLWYSDSHSLAVLSAVLSAGYEIRNNIIWNKNMAQFGAIGAQYKTKHEPCLYCYKKGNKSNWNGPNNEVSVWDISRASKNEFHPTQKPVELACRAIGNHKANVVLDLFGGSGSTLIGCAKIKRICRMMELSPAYCDVIRRRWTKWATENEQDVGSGGLE